MPSINVFWPFAFLGQNLPTDPYDILRAMEFAFCNADSIYPSRCLRGWM